jgi:hypothetical protein
MFFLFSAGLGAVLAYWLIESGYAIPAFIGLCIWIALLWAAHILSLFFYSGRSNWSSDPDVGIHHSGAWLAPFADPR